MVEPTMRHAVWTPHHAVASEHGRAHHASPTRRTGATRMPHLCAQLTRARAAHVPTIWPPLQPLGCPTHEGFKKGVSSCFQKSVP
eukprot:88836-Chlamydomonas_euryale.AAC.1